MHDDDDDVLLRFTHLRVSGPAMSPRMQNCCEKREEFDTTYLQEQKIYGQPRDQDMWRARDMVMIWLGPNKNSLFLRDIT